MNLQPLEPFSIILLIIAIFIAGVLTITGLLAAKDTHSFHAALVLVGVGVAIVVFTLAVILLIPQALLCSLSLLIYGLLGMIASATLRGFRPRRRGRLLYDAAYAVGGEVGAQIAFIMVGFAIFLCGLFGTANFFGLVN